MGRCPVPLDIARLRKELSVTETMWREFRLVRQTGSTNEDTRLAAMNGALEGLVIVAEEQTAGRGRRGRVWHSAAYAGLAVSVLLRPAVPRDAWGWLPLLAGVSTAQATEPFADTKIRLKWPNDLLTGAGRKLGGILVEGVGDAAVVGIGLNVHKRPELLDSSASLESEGAVAVDRTALLAAILQTLSENYRSWHNAQGDADRCELRDVYRSLCLTLGKRVALTLEHDGHASISNAEAVDIDAGGRLLLREGGDTFSLSAGDVTHLRESCV